MLTYDIMSVHPAECRSPPLIRCAVWIPAARSQGFFRTVKICRTASKSFRHQQQQLANFRSLYHHFHCGRRHRPFQPLLCPLSCCAQYLPLPCGIASQTPSRLRRSCCLNSKPSSLLHCWKTRSLEPLNGLTPRRDLALSPWMMDLVMSSSTTLVSNRKDSARWEYVMVSINGTVDALIIDHL